MSRRNVGAQAVGPRWKHPRLGDDEHRRPVSARQPPRGHLREARIRQEPRRVPRPLRPGDAQIHGLRAQPDLACRARACGEARLLKRPGQMRLACRAGKDAEPRAIGHHVLAREAIVRFPDRQPHPRHGEANARVRPGPEADLPRRRPACVHDACHAVAVEPGGDPRARAVDRQRIVAVGLHRPIACPEFGLAPRVHADKPERPSVSTVKR